MGGIILLFVLCAIAIVDGSYSSIIVALLVILAGGVHLVPIRGKESKQLGIKLFFIVTSVYLCSALAFSYSFSASSYFLTSDPMRYFARYLNRDVVAIDYEALNACYFSFADNNALYNELIANFCALSNKYLGGATVLSLTLVHTLFGVMTCIVVFRFLLERFSPRESFKIALVFSVCSQLLFYSSVVLRDIIIVYFYTRAFEIVLSRFSLRRIIILLVMLSIVWGIRLYSGLYFGVFIFTYAFVNSYKSRFRFLFSPIFIAFTLFAAIYVYYSTSLVEQSIEEINEYAIFTSESEAAAGGLITALFSLPKGVSEMAILLYSQMSPFPSYLAMRGVHTLSQFIMALDIILYEFVWYLIFYTMVLSIFFKKGLRFLTFDEIVLLLVALLFLLANTAHPDIRRMLPVYPIILYSSYRIRIAMSNKEWFTNNCRFLVLSWVGLLSLYLLIK